MSAPLTNPLKSARFPFHLMTKPVGSVCNLDCTYCFYLEKARLYEGQGGHRMKREVLATYIRSYIAAQPGREVSFAWQGGEPTLCGVDFFREAMELQQRYGAGRNITNAFQTNGTLLDDEWGEFLAKHNFLVGISIDGPRRVHDGYRVDKGQNPTFDRVMNGIDVLKRHKVEFNTLTTVHRKNSHLPLDVYRFLREIGSGYIQFIPIVERAAEATAAAASGLWLAPPPTTPTPTSSTRSSPNGACAPPITAIFSALFLTNGSKPMSAASSCNNSTAPLPTGPANPPVSACFRKNADAPSPLSTTATFTPATITFIRTTSSAM
ncbi:radical SAM protein [Ereboglobus luteus]|uniref:radical SAM protein n=1 Tax=Ereboglobus luteus TaxID=1796921 RepID=UPI00192E04AE|nr:radical SAM protein [Ereboglobus luteus]